MFTEASDGDLRSDQLALRGVSHSVGISDQWATVEQVHGSNVVRVCQSGEESEADAIWTTIPGLPVAIFTADCFGVILLAEKAVGVAHAGWRGARAGVVQALRDEMSASGHTPVRAAIGPGIGSCCFEVGSEVVVEFPDDEATTTWGTPSVDLREAIRRQLDGLDVWASDACTCHDEGWYSHRRDATRRRMANVGWVR